MVGEELWEEEVIRIFLRPIIDMLPGLDISASTQETLESHLMDLLMDVQRNAVKASNKVALTTA